MTISRRGAGFRSAAVLLLVAAGVVAVGGSAAQPPGSAGRSMARLTPAAATRIVRGYAADWSAAVANRDRAALGRIQTGAALAANSAVFASEEAMGLRPVEGLTLAEAKAVVPRPERPAFPARFLALVTWTSPQSYPSHEVLEFEQARQGARWQMRNRARLINNVPLPSLTVDPDGYATMIDARDDQALRYGAKDAAELLASYYDQYRQPDAGRTADTAVAPGPFSTGLTKRRAASNQTTQIQQMRRYRPDAYRTAAYRLDDGGGLLLLSLTGSRTVFPRDPRLVLMRQGDDRRNFGGLVPPGMYRSINFEMVTTLAVEVPRAGSDGGLRVVGMLEEDVSAAISAA
jgi:hypothetical protein